MDEFSLHTLIGLVRKARALLDRGDSLASPLGEGRPLNEEQRQILGHAVQAWVNRIVNVHMAPAHDEPAVTLRDLISMAKACDALVVRGDGHPTPLPDAAVGMTFTARQVLLHRAAQHPNGDLVVESAVQTTTALAPRDRATEARRSAVAEAAKRAETPRPAPPLASLPPAAAQRPEQFATPKPAAPEPEPEEETFVLTSDMLRFKPDPEPLDPSPDPQKPGPAAPPEPGRTEAR